ncbi:hypothetical protein [Amycolatopsis sp. NPDC021455]|uniref:hypothetical protein n=1 Tax=Amycolatopsis sp. NPDC021455 TaxID=3154901 RepID=UPI0033E29098
MKVATTAAIACLATATLAGCAATAQQDQPAPRPDQGVRPATVGVVSEYHAAGRDWRLVSYRDPADAYCIAVDQRDRQGIPACGLELDARHPVNAAMQAVDDHLVVLYGLVDSKVRDVYAVVAGKRVGQSIGVDSYSGKRCFAVFVVDRSTTDVVAVADDGTDFSLKEEIDEFYTPG